MLLRGAGLAALAGLLTYAAAGALVARKVRRGSLADDPDHDLDAHALLSIVMCWPHDLQSLRADETARLGAGAAGD
jgi:hypothetical protein